MTVGDATGTVFYWVRVGEPGWPTVYEGWSYNYAASAAAPYIGRDEYVIVDTLTPPAQSWERLVWNTPHQVAPNPLYEAGAPAPGSLPSGLAWTNLSEGDVPIRKGYYYDARASVKVSHDRASIEGLLKSKGMQLLSYEEGNAVGGYREVHLVALATQDAGTVPWRVPWFVPGDSSGLLSVKTAPAASGKPALTTSSGSTGLYLGLTALAGGLGWVAWRRYKGKPILPRLRA